MNYLLAKSTSKILKKSINEYLNPLFVKIKKKKIQILDPKFMRF